MSIKPNPVLPVGRGFGTLMVGPPHGLKRWHTMPVRRGSSIFELARREVAAVEDAWLIEQLEDLIVVSGVMLS